MLMLNPYRLQWKNIKTRTNILTGAVSKMNLVIDELTTKMERFEVSAARRMMTLSGFYLSPKKKIRSEQLLDFFREQMKIEIELEDSFLIGEAEPKLVIITLGSVADKRRIYANVHNIKDMVNKDGKKLFFRDYYPAAAQEYRRRNQDVIDQVKQHDANARVAFGSKGLELEDQVYVKRVKASDPTDILQMSEAELEYILKMKLSKAPKLMLKDNVFVGYSLPVSSFDEIQRAYMHVKLANAGARHVVCAWRIPGPKPHECNDYLDDGDHGCGRVLLELLTNNRIDCRAIFVARYSANKLGQERYGSYATAACKAVNQSAYNSITKSEQLINEDTDVDMEATSNNQVRNPTYQRGSSYTRGQRGRGRGRGRENPRGGLPPRTTSRNHQPKERPTQPTQTYNPISEESIQARKKRASTEQLKTFTFRNPWSTPSARNEKAWDSDDIDP